MALFRRSEFGRSIDQGRKRDGGDSTIDVPGDERRRPGGHVTHGGNILGLGIDEFQEPGFVLEPGGELVGAECFVVEWSTPKAHVS